MACGYRVSDCLKRPLNSRVFSRKDKLVQYIKNFHGCAVDPLVVNWWSSGATGAFLLWNCGFCEVTMMTWDERAAHIGRHFRDGKDMSMWQSSVSPNAIAR
jgi:hypothetical protein